jgi:hypothetical protein
MSLQFEQFDGNMADIKQVDTLPPPNQIDWKYRRPGHIPPQRIAKQWLFLYYHPESTRGAKYMLGHIPMRADLLVNQGPKSEIGYGLLLVDSWSGAKQAWSLALLVFTNLLVFRAILSVRGLLRWNSAFSNIVQHSNVDSMTITLVDLGSTLLISSFTLLALTSLEYTSLGLVSSQFWIRRIIKYVALSFSFPSVNATRSGDSQPALQTAKRVEWVNVSRITSSQVLDD